MHVNQAQKLFTYMGYYANGFARESLRSIERLTRPMPQGNAYWKEVAERVKRTVSALFSIPFAAALFIPALACYFLAAHIGTGRFELIEPKRPVDSQIEHPVKVVSLNACLQDPYSPFTGGVVTPFERVSNCASRVEALANAVEKENPDVFLGQEFENLGAQDESIRLLQQRGFCYFLRDLGSNDPVRNNSGLFVASKTPLRDVEFAPYPIEDRAGLARWSGQGALTFTIPVQGRKMRFINVHLNYGSGPENQAARNRQLTRHAVPLLKRGNAVLLGDLNFNTASVDRAASVLQGFVNELEGKVTCTDEGKHALRGKSRTPGSQPCEDCEERIDGLVYDPKQVQVLASETKLFRLDGQLLSDHYVTTASLQAVS